MPIGASGFLLAIAGFVYCKRRRRQRLPHGIDEVDQATTKEDTSLIDMLNEPHPIPIVILTQ